MDDPAFETTSAPPSPLEVPLAAGARIGEYRVSGTLGRGAYGTVYAAEHPVIGKRVAIKLLSASCSARADLVSRFVAEARLVNRVGHPNIVDIFAFGRHTDGRYYHVMELLNGETLGALLARRGRLDGPYTLALLRPIALALDAAHGAGVVHRDLKPANVLLHQGPDGQSVPKLVDFGVAKLLGEDRWVAHRTGTGEALGTPDYMAPEQCVGAEVDHRADLYALALVAYRCLSGGQPFRGESVVEILHAQAVLPPRDPRQLCPLLGDRTAAALLSGLAKDPEDRAPTATALVDDLEEAIRLDGAVPATLPLPGPRRRVWPRWVGAGVALGLAAATVAVLSTRGPPASAVGLAPPQPMPPAPVATPPAAPAVEVSDAPAPSTAPRLPTRTPADPKAGAATPKSSRTPAHRPARGPEGSDDVEEWR